jgi:predicted acetyltransferase
MSSGGEARTLNLEIIDAGDERWKPVLAHLFELYVYDFSEYTGSDVHDSGSYEVVETDYWNDAFPHRYIATVDGKIAGFALVRRGSPLDDDAGASYVEEFFVLRKFRRRGVGGELARHVFAKFPGRWQVAVLRNNLPAQAFWRGAIGALTDGRYEERERDDEKWRGPVLYFDNSSSGASSTAVR